MTDVLPKQMGWLYIITKGALINQAPDAYLHSLVLGLRRSTATDRSVLGRVSSSIFYNLLCNRPPYPNNSRRRGSRWCEWHIKLKLSQYETSAV